MNVHRRHALGILAASACPTLMAATKLSWDDLFSQDPSIDFQRIFSLWPRLNVGRARPIGMSSLGACFFERPDGAVHVLDPLLGEIAQAVSSAADFGKSMNSPAWQDRFLRPSVVREVVARGLTREPSQVFGFAPHPRFGGGSLDPRRAVVLDAVVWHSIAAQSF